MSGKGVSMKYLATARWVNEPDNNTPSDVIWCRVVDIEPSEVAKYEKAFENEFSGYYTYGVEIELRPLAEFNEWVKVSEIW